jgi:NADPH2:quinone reductase
VLNSKGSLFVTRPSLWHYIGTRDELVGSASVLFHAVKHGDVHVGVGQEFPLREAASAHRALEERRTVGSTVLLP